MYFSFKLQVSLHNKIPPYIFFKFFTRIETYKYYVSNHQKTTVVKTKILKINLVTLNKATYLIWFHSFKVFTSLSELSGKGDNKQHLIWKGKRAGLQLSLFGGTWNMTGNTHHAMNQRLLQQIVKMFLLISLKCCNTVRNKQF